MKKLRTPLTEQEINELHAGDQVVLSGEIFCGRDAVLPKVVKAGKECMKKEYDVELQGSVIFHTAVSPAGIGPTSSNKLEIESSIGPLSEMGVKIHLGKGMIKPETIEKLDEENAVFAVIPPVTALLKSKTMKQDVAAFPEEGMEALYRLEVEEIPLIIAAAHGETVFK